MLGMTDWSRLLIDLSKCMMHVSMLLMWSLWCSRSWRSSELRFGIAAAGLLASCWFGTVVKPSCWATSEQCLFCGKMVLALCYYCVQTVLSHFNTISVTFPGDVSSM